MLKKSKLCLTIQFILHTHNTFQQARSLHSIVYVVRRKVPKEQMLRLRATQYKEQFF